MTLLEQAANLYSRGLPEEALRVAKNGLAIEPQNEAGLCDVAAASAYALGDHALAEQLWRKVLLLKPKAADAPYNLGVLLASTGREAEAEQCFSRATDLNPRFADAHIALGRCYAESKRIAEAEKCFRRALTIDPRLATVHFHLGLLLFESGRHKESEGSYRRAIALDARFAEAFNNLGDLLSRSKRETEAEGCFRQAIALEPEFADAHYNLGNLLSTIGRNGEAETRYRGAIVLNPQFTRAHLNLGLLLEQAGQDPQAEQCYRRAIASDLNFSDAYFRLGNMLVRLRRNEEAERCFRRAISLNDRHAESFVDFGNLLFESARYQEAESAYRRALELKSSFVNLLPNIIHAAKYSCSWQQMAQDVSRLRAQLIGKEAGFVEAPGLLSIPEVSPLEQRSASLKYAQSRWLASSAESALTRSFESVRHDRLRIGYLSAHFHSHAVSNAVAGVFESHDSSCVAVYGYSYGPEILDEARHRIQSACEVFRDLRSASDDAAARRIVDDEIDILVDLVGYTGGCRPGIAALRPAPIVVNWLGYPGTLGHARLADYIIGDPIVTPLAHAEHFSETLALMPHCYLPYDRSRVVGARPSRQEADLPDSGFVFCSFSQPYKLNPDTFDVWCRLLREVPGSVLWLQASRDLTIANLRREATERGVDPERLVFARRVQSDAEHLGRLQLADLALDTFPYTSHSTGCDALWAGVPMVTRIGETFVSRVAASLLHAVGLPDLVAQDSAAYFALARNFALDPEMLHAVRQKLSLSLPTAPLFDTTRFARDLERLYREMWAQRQHGSVAPVGNQPQRVAG